MSGLELRDVVKTRGQGRRVVTALHGVSLSIEPGEVVLLKGPSGSGKTTLLAVAAGLLSPDSGDVSIGGQPLRTVSRSREIGFVFQRPNLLARLTVRENVLLAAALAGRSSRDARRETDELLADLSVEPLADLWPSQLSGGEEQRVAVARALIHRPAVILADEPTASLDAASGRAVAESLRRLAVRSAVLIATHDDRLVPYATRTLRLEDGRCSPS